MSSLEDAFLQRLRATFKVEAEEHLHAISARLLELEKNPVPDRQAEHVEAAFRHAHSLKGAARAVNLTGIEAVCQALESIFAAWKRRESSPAPEHFDVLHYALDLIGSGIPTADGQLADIDEASFQALARQLAGLSTRTPSGGAQRASEAAPLPPPAAEPPAAPPAAPPEEPSTEPIAEPAEAVRKAVDTQDRTAVAPVRKAPPAASERLPSAQTVRISTAKLDQLLLVAEEMLHVKLSTARRTTDLRNLQAFFDRWRTEWNRIQPHVRALRNAADQPSQNNGASHLPNVLDFLDWNLAQLKSLEDQLQAIGKAAAQDQAAAGKRVDELLADAKQLVMLPFSTLLDLFPRIVRDLSREQGKEVTLATHGAEVEMDKRILEHMKDALIHLVRNAIDHGIEKPDVRAQRHKPSPATLTISVAQVDGNKVEIRVSDDGAGIDVASVKAAAIRRGVLSEADAERLSDEQALALIFQSDVSTSPLITELSGRGLGLAIVREKTEELGGQVVVETHLHAGTTFRITLPTLLSTFRGVQVRVADRWFVIPTAHVRRVARLDAAEVKTVENRETITLGGQVLSLARLDAVLGLPRAPGLSETPAFLSVAVLSADGEQIAFAVDEVLREEEVLVKSLSRPLSRVRNIAGATILDAGKVVPVLHVPDLMKSARRTGFAPQPTAAGREPTAPRKRILVAEDSITSRMLLKNILESAGHEVRTAVDGVEALTELRIHDFDLVVSDIEMPRMNGFDLTAHIRSDRKLADMPVILVTALSSREDRERGIDVGANAYIVKSSFDQSNLLEAVRRLA